MIAGVLAGVWFVGFVWHLATLGSDLREQEGLSPSLASVILSGALCWPIIRVGDAIERLRDQ